ncbi:Crp/Fnr family transcriptional regulator [Saccharicrinis sp. FJH54]|uniref:Crp/Fnr family transcriptional regulator n=1 Tax=Saccharicrinis sp. FJH54 TaxID=3344665 RepID=UPI0035D4F634
MEEHQVPHLNSIFSKSSCFMMLTEDELDFISTKKRQIVYNSGETVCKQGAFAPYVLYVLDGLVKVFVETGRGKFKSISLMKGGDFIAFSTVFGESVYNYTAMALKESAVCMIDKEGLKKILKDNRDFAFNIVSRNYRTENHLLEIIKTITHKQMPGKLATTLLYLAQEDFLKEDVFQHLTRKEIAEFAGITMESTVKLLKEFEQDKLISLDGKDIKILDKHGLEDVSIKG